MYVIITHLREEYELRVWTDNEMKVRVNALRVLTRAFYEYSFLIF